jgi:outer membrane porin, OprD family
LNIICTARRLFPSPDFAVKRLLFAILFFLLLIRSTGWTNPPDYLTNDREPADRASQLASPFTEVVTEQPVGRLGAYFSEPFFRNAEFSMQPRYYYRSLRNSSGEQEAFAAGGSLSLTSGWWRDTLQLGVTGYTTQPVFAPNGAGNTGLLQPNGDGFSVLGQAWARLKAGPATATLFRQALQLPFINGNDSRMIPNTFEAYQLEVDPWKSLRLNFGYVAAMKPRTSANFEPMSEIAGAPQVNRGTSYAGFLLGSEERTYLGAIGQLTWDLFSCGYMQAGQTWQLSQNVEIRGDVQFIDQRSVGRELLGSFNTELYGARLTASYAGALVSMEVTDTTDGTGVRNPFGGDPSFNSLMISNFNQGGEKSYGIGITYNFSKFGLNGLRAFASYVYGCMPAGRWEEEVNATVDYRISIGALKNCWLRLRYAYNASNAPVPTEDFRAILNYTIIF